MYQKDIYKTFNRTKVILFRGNRYEGKLKPYTRFCNLFKVAFTFTKFQYWNIEYSISNVRIAPWKTMKLDTRFFNKGEMFCKGKLPKKNVLDRDAKYAYCTAEILKRKYILKSNKKIRNFLY